jgi:twitching motility protein PilT
VTSKKGRKTSRVKLGELLLEHQVVTEDQMNAALKRQETMGGRLGQNLVHLNYVNEEVLLEFLSRQLNITSINLNTLAVSPEVQRMVPLDRMQKLGVFPVKKEGNALLLGMTDPTDLDAVRELEFSLGMKIVPLALAESQWDYAMNFVKKRGWGKETLAKKAKKRRVLSADYDLTLLLRELVAQKGSDIHLSVGVQPTFRIGDQLIRLDLPPVDPGSLERLIQPVLTATQKEYLNSHNEMDFALSFDGIGRFRFNIFRQRNNLAAVMRHVPERIPSLQELELPPWLPEYAMKKQGLVLITGPSGHGKSTTLACLIDIINSTRRVNIITLEDPIEYVHSHKMSNINQRELGTDTASFGDGIKYIFRQDPDVIAIGEMRDLESISTAITAAETGHLVLATLHTQNAFSTIDRIIDVFPSNQQNQIRHQLTETLLLILSQRLVPQLGSSQRILACEQLRNSYRVQNAIREKRIHLFRGQATSSLEDYTPIEVSLAELYRTKRMKYEEGLRFAEDQKLYETLAKK